MKKLKYLTMSLALAAGMTGCSLDTEIYDNKGGDEAFSTMKDISNGLNGAYYYLGTYRFLGNYAVAFGDFVAGVSAGSASSGHFYAYSSFTFSDTDAEIEDVWNYGYKVVTSTTNCINGANALIESGKVLESEMPELNNYLGQCYALKALANYYLVNIYALPYSDENKDKPGIVVIKDNPTVPFSQIKRSTVAETYAQITDDIAAAEKAFAEAGGAAEQSAYYMGPMGLQALKARVLLSLGDYDGAETAAKNAIRLKGTGSATEADNNPSDAAYLTMWASTAVTAEDIFTIVKSEDDNLSANALNTLYGSYYCTIQNSITNLIGENDIRAGLLRPGDGGGTSLIKYDGKPSQAVTNIPVFRKSEMALVVAECEARKGNIAEAQNYFMYTGKRDKDLDASDLPATKEGMLSVIAEERVREFFGEGHRFYDARRMGLLVSGDQFQNWDIRKFCFPIPQAEINTDTGCTQNEGWEDNMPF